MINQSGIYQIRNLVNGKVYVGSAKKFKSRWGQHRTNLRSKSHHSSHLQRAWNKYGADNFVFEPLITCAPSMLIWYEQQFLDQMRPEYNVNPNAKNSLGVKRTAEQRALLSRIHTGKKISAAHRKAIGDGCRGRKHRPESIAKMCRVQAGRTFTDETKQRMSAAQRSKVSLTMYTVDGITRSMSEWAEITGLTVSGIYGRMYTRGWSIEDAIKTPLPQTKTYEYKGEHKTILQWALSAGLKRNTVEERLKRGWSMDAALNTPTRTQGKRGSDGSR